MMNFLRVLSFTQVLAFACFVSAPAYAQRDLGGVNIEDFCQRKWGARAILVNRDAYGWRCRVTGANVTVGVGLPRGVNASAGASGTDYEISVNEVCEQQHGRGAVARSLNPRDPYSWRCFR